MNKYNCTYNDRIGVIPVALIVKAGLIVAPYIAKWGKSAFAHPARDAKDFIANAKDTIISDTAEDRIAKVIAYSQKISPKAIDVNTREWLKWYKQNYREDYKQISPELKRYWNDYLNTIRNTYGNVNRIFEDLDAAAFTGDEINYSEPGENVLTNITATGSKLPYILYGGIGLLFVYLLSRKK